MKVCNVEELVGEEILAKDVFTAEYMILLSMGTQLKKEYIEKLKELQVKEVWIEESEPHAKRVLILKEEVEESFKYKVKSILEKHTYSHNEELEEIGRASCRERV